MADNIKYPCSGCGACCHHVDQAADAANMSENKDLHFPYSWDETGKCEKLGDDNKCTIYDSRPLICNIGALAEHFNLDKKHFFNKNIEGCNRLIDQDNLPEHFKIKPLI